MDALSVPCNFATTTDYLVKTYFRLFNITSGPLYQKLERRLNNIIFNNFDKIYMFLVRRVYLFVCQQQLVRDLRHHSFFSCIYSYETKMVTVQYFDKKIGVVHKILGCCDSRTSVVNLLQSYDLAHKIAGYCGDYYYKDPCLISSSDCVIDIANLNGNLVLDLPNSDEFFQFLFNNILDYAPCDIIRPLLALGEMLKANYSFNAELTEKFVRWQNTKQHILASDYSTFILQNLDSLHRSLEPFDHLPASVADFFGSVSKRFCFMFFKGLFEKLLPNKLSDNSAVVYYAELVNLRKKLEEFEDSNFLPLVAFNYMSNETERNCSSDEEHMEISSKVTKLGTQTFARAKIYLQTLLKQFDDFDPITWVLLRDLPIKLEDVHAAAHRFTDKSICRGCGMLLKEVKLLNAMLRNEPLLEIESVAAKWVLIFSKADIPRVLHLVKFLLSLPAVRHCVEWRIGQSFSENMVRNNWKRMEFEDIIQSAEQLFGRGLVPVEAMIKLAQVPVLVD